MKNKKVLIPLIIVLVGIIALLVGTSYAYFTSNITGNDTANQTVITSGNMRLALTDGQEIALNNAIPGDSVKKTFSVENTGTLTTTYDVYFSELCNIFVDKTDLVYTIRHTSANGYELLTETEVPSTSSKIIDSQSIAPNETQTYEITIKFLNKDEIQDDNQGAYFATKININKQEDATSCPVKVGRTLCTLNCDTDNDNVVDTNIDNNNDGICDSSCSTPNATVAPLVPAGPLYDAILAQESESIAAHGNTAPDFTLTEPVAVYTDGGMSEDTRNLPAIPNNYYTYSDSYTFNDGNGSSYSKTNYKLNNPQVGKYSDIYSNLVGKYVIDTVGYFESGVDTSSRSAIYYITAATENKITYKTVANSVSYEKRTEGMYKTTDDLGDVYYYRGAIDDNYVMFGGFCWRVVRTNGDHSVRLIYQGTTCDATKNNAAIGGYAYNSSYDDNAYVGYMYGTAGSSTYAATHANTNSSNAKTQLENWYATNLASYDDYIADQIFCNDRKVSTEWTSSKGLGYGKNATSYGAYERSSTSEGNFDTTQYPTLICSQAADKFTKTSTNGNGKLSQKVGMLTYDEAVMAGGFGGTENYRYYLYTGAYWWLGSPYYMYYMNNAYVFNVNPFGNVDYSVVWNTYGLRPVVSLLPSVQVAQGGNGTQANPWVIVTQ